jgi:hypothetical protein
MVDFFGNNAENDIVINTYFLKKNSQAVTDINFHINILIIHKLVIRVISSSSTFMLSFMKRPTLLLEDCVSSQCYYLIIMYYVICYN